MGLNRVFERSNLLFREQARDVVLSITGIYHHGLQFNLQDSEGDKASTRLCRTPVDLLCTL